MNTDNVVTLDIETIPDQRPGALDAFRAAVQQDFKAPSGLTKEKACADLGMTDPSEIKFTSKDRALELWAERFKEEKSEEVAQAEYRKTSFNGAAGQIAVVGLAFDDTAPFSIYRSDWENPGSESEIIHQAFEAIADSYNPNSMRAPLFVGHYIAQFDLRFLFQRAVILGIKPPSIIPFQAKPWDEQIFDTMTRWAGAQGSVSLDALCAALGIAGKPDGIDGSKVWDFVQAGRIDEVADYCEGDIRMARNAYKAMTFQPLLLELQPERELDLIPF